MDIRNQLDTDWLKAKINVNDGDHIRFLDEGKEEPNRQGEKSTVLSVGIVRNGEIVAQKKFRFNKGNLKATSAIYGFESSKWVGKEMRVNVAKVPNPQMNGALVDGIILSAPNISAQGDVIVG